MGDQLNHFMYLEQRCLCGLLLVKSVTSYSGTSNKLMMDLTRNIITLTDLGALGKRTNCYRTKGPVIRDRQGSAQWE